MADPIAYDDFAKVELRVAKVLEARPHPNADKLMLLQIDVGDEQKQIVAGIRQHYTPEQLVGKLIVVVNNLARDAPGRDLQRHAPGRHLGREGHPADGRRPGVRRGGEDQVSDG